MLPIVTVALSTLPLKYQTVLMVFPIDKVISVKLAESSLIKWGEGGGYIYKILSFYLDYIGFYYEGVQRLRGAACAASKQTNQRQNELN